MRILTYLSTLLLLVLVGCSDQSSDQNNDANNQPAANAEPSALEFVIITTGASSGIKTDMTSIYKLDTQQSWDEFWAQHTQNIQPPEQTPDIDFTKNMVVAIVDSDQPSSGYQLNIDQLEAVDDKLYIFATRKQPGAGCVSLGMISQPFVMIELPKSDLIPELRLTFETIPCQ